MTTPIEALRELVECKTLREEYDRRKQRRVYVFRRDEDEVRLVDAMLSEYHRRKPLAWAAARAALAAAEKAAPKLPILTDAQIADIGIKCGCAVAAGDECYTIWFDGDLTPFARAVLAAARAPQAQTPPETKL